MVTGGREGLLTITIGKGLEFSRVLRVCVYQTMSIRTPSARLQSSPF